MIRATVIVVGGAVVCRIALTGGIRPAARADGYTPIRVTSSPAENAMATVAGRSTMPPENSPRPSAASNQTSPVVPK